MSRVEILIIVVFVAVTTSALVGMYCNYNIPNMCSEKTVVVLNGVPYRCHFEEIKE